MEDFWKSALGVLGTIAPGLATALGGPLAGAAVGAIISALGLPADTSAEEVAAQVASASPETLLKLKAAEQDFTKAMRALDIDLEKIAAGDRDSARQREVQIKDWTPAILAYLVTVGFFGALGWLLVAGKPEIGGDALLVMLGSLGTAWTAIISYYYGSTAGSKLKTEALFKK